MKEQIVVSRIKDGKIDAEVHADSFDSAVTMFLEIAEAICVQAERTGIAENKKVCGATLAFALAEKYVDSETAEKMKAAMDNDTTNMN